MFRLKEVKHSTEACVLYNKNWFFANFAYFSFYNIKRNKNFSSFLYIRFIWANKMECLKLFELSSLSLILSPMKTSALVLSGGGALGIAHLGALEELQKNYTFNWYGGVSAGAIVAAFLALEKSPQYIWDVIRDKKLFKILFDVTPRSFGVLAGEKVYTLLDELFEGKTFEDTAYPLFIGATNFSTGQRITISRGKIVDAVRASLSVPVIFEPFWHEGEQAWLVDGGLSQNFPVDYAIEHYLGDSIIGIDVGSNIDDSEDFGQKHFWTKGKYLTNTIVRTFRIFYKSQQHFQNDPRVKIITPDVAEFSAVDVLKMKELYERGKDSVKSFVT